MLLIWGNSVLMVLSSFWYRFWLGGIWKVRDQSSAFIQISLIYVTFSRPFMSEEFAVEWKMRICG